MRKLFQSPHEVLYIECACQYGEHVLRMELNDYGYEKELDIEDCVDLDLAMLLPQNGFFKRIFWAFRYVFRPIYFSGWWGTSINVADVPKIVDFLHKYESIIDKYKTELKNDSDQGT